MRESIGVPGIPVSQSGKAYANQPDLGEGDHVHARNVPRFLMCRPEHFAVNYRINPWMDPQAWACAEHALADAAEQQWAALYQVLTDKGAAIEFVKPQPGLPDLVFTANAAIVLDGKALLSRFRHQQRRREEPILADAFYSLQAGNHVNEIVDLPDHLILEGAGDCIWEVSQELAGFSEQASHVGAPLERLSRVGTMLERIGVATRRA